MKTKLTLLLFIVATSAFSQLDVTKHNKDYAKDIVKALDTQFSYLNTTLQIDGNTVTADYHFDIGRIKEESDDNVRLYYFWDNQLLSVFDEKLKKQLFFIGDYKNASTNMYNFYLERAIKYAAEFEPYLVSTGDVKLHKTYFYSNHSIRITCSANRSTQTLLNMDCIIDLKDRFEVTKMSVTYLPPGGYVEEQYENCILPDKLKNKMMTERWKFSFLILLKEKKSNKTIYLPEITF